MKKRLFALLLSLILVFTFAACGTSDPAPARIWAGCFQAEIPEGYVVNETETVFENPDNNHQKIQFYFTSGVAEDAIQRSIEIFNGSNVREDDITVGDYTWLVETYEWNGADSCTLYLDAGDGKHFIEINFFELAVDGPEVTQFLNTFVLEEDAYNKHVEFLHS